MLKGSTELIGLDRRELGVEGWAGEEPEKLDAVHMDGHASLLQKLEKSASLFIGSILRLKMSVVFWRETER